MFQIVAHERIAVIESITETESRNDIDGKSPAELDASLGSFSSIVSVNKEAVAHCQKDAERHGNEVDFARWEISTQELIEGC